jgi:hypothetical protein
MPDVIALTDFANAFAANVNALDLSDVHPSGRGIVWEWVCEMRYAAEEGSAEDVARLARYVNEKIADEKAWHQHCLQSAQRMGGRP